MSKVFRRVVSGHVEADPDGGNRRVEVQLSCGHKTRRTLKGNRSHLVVGELRCRSCERRPALTRARKAGSRG